jgi:hypothetical protein
MKNSHAHFEPIRFASQRRVARMKGRVIGLLASCLFMSLVPAVLRAQYSERLTLSSVRSRVAPNPVDGSRLSFRAVRGASEEQYCGRCSRPVDSTEKNISGKRVLVGAFLGLVSGAAAGFLYGKARHRNCPESCGLEVGGDVLAGAFIGLLAGTFLAGHTGR